MRKWYLKSLMVCIVLIGACVGAARCEEEEPPPMGWTNRMLAYLNLNQASYSNWTAGGENNMGWQTGLIGGFTNRTPAHEWVNTVKMIYGMQKVGDAEAIKSVDEMVFTTVYTRTVKYYVNPYVAFKFESQFSKGYEYTDTSKIEVSNFMDPGYFTESIGIGRSWREIVRSRLGVAFKQTVTDKFPIPYADDPETEDKIEKTRYQTGIEWVTNLALPIGENLELVSVLDLFSDAKGTNKIDVRWDNLLVAKVAEYVTVSLDFKLFYDRDISTKRQIRQALAIGLSYAIL